MPRMNEPSGQSTGVVFQTTVNDAGFMPILPNGSAQIPATWLRWKGIEVEPGMQLEITVRRINVTKVR